MKKDTLVYRSYETDGGMYCTVLTDVCYGHARDVLEEFVDVGVVGSVKAVTRDAQMEDVPHRCVFPATQQHLVTQDSLGLHHITIAQTIH